MFTQSIEDREDECWEQLRKNPNYMDQLHKKSKDSTYEATWKAIRCTIPTWQEITKD
jgi:hypothetical protein